MLKLLDKNCRHKNKKYNVPCIPFFLLKTKWKYFPHSFVFLCKYLQFHKVYIIKNSPLRQKL